MKFTVLVIPVAIIVTTLESRKLVSWYNVKILAPPIAAERKLTRMDPGTIRSSFIRKMNLHGLIERNGDVLYSKFLREVFVQRKKKGVYEFTFWRCFLQVPFIQVTPAEWLEIEEDCRIVNPMVIIPQKQGQYQIQVAFYNAMGQPCDATFFIYIYVQTQRN